MKSRIQMSKSDKRKQYGVLIKAARKRANLNQAEASDLVGVTQGCWSKFESGLHIPTLDVFVRFVSAAKISQVDLYDFMRIEK